MKAFNGFIWARVARSMFLGIGLVFLIAGRAAGQDDTPVPAPRDSNPQPRVIVLSSRSETASVYSPMDARYTEAVRGMIEDLLVNRRVRVVERARVDDMLQEMGLGKSALVDSDSSVKMGKVLGAQFIVIGEVQNVSSETESSRAYGTTSEKTTVKASVRVRAIDISTGEIFYSKVLMAAQSYESTNHGSDTDSDAGFRVVRYCVNGLNNEGALLIKLAPPRRMSSGAGGQSSAMISVSFAPTPPKCDILIDGQYRGSSPTTLHLAAGAGVKVEIRKAGYEPWDATVTPSSDMNQVNPELGLVGSTAAPPATQPTNAPPSDATPSNTHSPQSAAPADNASTGHGNKLTESSPGGDGKTIDLLAQVHIPDDVIAGDWNRTNEGLEGHGRLRLKVPPGGEYDFHVQFARQTGNRFVALVMAYNQKSFAWSMGARNNTLSYFGNIDRSINGPRPKAIQAGAVIANKEKYDVVVKVRTNSVSAYVDGVLWSEFKTNYSNLTLGSNAPLAGSLGLNSPDPTIYYQADVTPIPDDQPASDQQPQGNRQAASGEEPASTAGPGRDDGVQIWPTVK